MQEIFSSCLSRIEPATSLLLNNLHICGLGYDDSYKHEQVIVQSEFLLQNQQEQINFALLNYQNLDRVEILQQIVINKLQKESKDKFLYKKERSDFENIMKSQNSFILGCFVAGELAGQIIVSQLNNDDMAEGKDYHINIDMKKRLQINDNFKLFSIGGMIVHPDFRGRNLAKNLIAQAEHTLNKKFTNEKVALLSISSSENPSSYSSLCHSGFCIISNFTSLEDGDNDYLMCKILHSKNKPIICANQEFCSSPESLISKIGEKVIAKNEKGFFTISTKSISSNENEGQELY